MILANASSTNIALSVLAACSYAWPAVRGAHLSAAVARAWVACAWLLHGAVIALGLLQIPAHFGFAPALSVTTWLVAAVYAVESRLYPQLQTRWPLASLGAVAILLACIFPGAALSATASVGQSAHLALGVASYGLFGTAVVHAWYMSRAEARIRRATDPDSGLPLLTLERLTYRFVAAGFVLLTFTLVVGYALGTDYASRAQAHKTFFATLSWVTFAGLLLGRILLGWRGKRATTVLYAGATFLLLAYAGSHFVLEVVLGQTS